MSDTTSTRPGPKASGEKRAAESDAFWAPKRDEIELLYHVEGLSLRAIGDRYGVCAAAVCYAFRRLGIKPRSRGTSGTRNGRFKDGSQSRVYRDLVEKQACETCGAAPPAVLDIHHRNGDHYDNRPENLQVLCRSCHMRETTAERWRKQRAGLPTGGNAPVNWGRHAAQAPARKATEAAAG